MKRKNMTLGDVAKKLNISIPYVSDIIKGNRKAEKYRSKIVELLEIKE
ncbi:helix-turn-helix transcriptional regulator [Tissierellaceae bacterium BX21]|uniref:Helix-turn-helix transcriptional regulator n=2 Tax=Paratissierella segnis TaxID=2763679 RepID=A0A926EZQ1_9FIRM|nr:helix-turn-helix transcriptional regulator [Paratissierella segnis]